MGELLYSLHNFQESIEKIKYFEVYHFLKKYCYLFEDNTQARALGKQD